jgi:tetratricopeptide (TPR) repeat protein
LDTDLNIKHKLASVANFKSHGKYLHAIQICEQLLIEFPNNSEINLELAELYHLSGNLTSSLHLFESYLDNNPKDKDVRLFYGQFLLKNRLWERAIQVFSKLVPEEKPIALFFLGYSYFMIKDFELARINYLSFLSLEADRELIYESYIYLAKIEIELKDFEQALSYAKQSELLFNSYWELYLIYAICYYNLGMDTHAVLSIEKSIKLNPKAIGSYEWAGKVCLHAGDYLKAENHFTKYVESTEEISSEIYNNLAEICLSTNRTKSALSYFDLALKIDPNNKNALYGKKNILEELESKLSKDV